MQKIYLDYAFQIFVINFLSCLRTLWTPCTFKESCKKLHLCTNILKDSDYSSDLFTNNAKYLQTLFGEKWRSSN